MREKKKRTGYLRTPVYLDVRAMVLRPKGQHAEEVEEPADLLGRQVVHVV